MGSRLAVLAQPLGEPIHRFRGLHIARPLGMAIIIM